MFFSLMLSDFSSLFSYRIIIISVTNESQVLGSKEMSHNRFYFYCGSSNMNEIERVAVQGFGLVNILAH